MSALERMVTCLDETCPCLGLGLRNLAESAQAVDLVSANLCDALIEASWEYLGARDREMFRDAAKAALTKLGVPDRGAPKTGRKIK